MIHFDSESVTFDNCPKVRSMIAAQILAVVQNRIPQASTFCGYIYIFFHGTYTMLYFVLRTKLMLFFFLHMFFYYLGNKLCDNIGSQIALIMLFFLSLLLRMKKPWYVLILSTATSVNRPTPPTVFPSDKFAPLHFIFVLPQGSFYTFFGYDLYTLPF